MTAADVQRAIAILSNVAAVEAAKILSVPLDLREFIDSNRLSLDETEIRELKAYFRA